MMKKDAILKTNANYQVAKDFHGLSALNARLLWVTTTQTSQFLCYILLISNMKRSPLVININTIILVINVYCCQKSTYNLF